MAADRIQSLRVSRPKSFKLDACDPGETLGWHRDGAITELEQVKLKLDALQQRLAAEARRSVLLILQAPDAGGKDGTIRAIFSGLNPAGVEVTGFKVPAGKEAVQVDGMVGGRDPGHVFEAAHPLIMRAQRNHPDLRFGASRMLYHELLPTILGQRITAGEALRQWHLLCLRLGEPAPGPQVGLLLPPSPHVLAGLPAWWFHPLGIEAKRANALRTVAKHATKLWEWAHLSLDAAAARLALLHGVGPWTIGSVMGTALGDPDAVAVGDYHLKNLVAFNLTGQARGTDEQMLEVLAPYAGQRGRVIRLLLLDGRRAPAFGPRRRILPMARW